MKNLKIFSVRLPESLIRKIKVYCAKNGMTVQEFMILVLDKACGR